MASRAIVGGATALPFIHPDDMPTLYCLKGVGTCLDPAIKDGALVAFDKASEAQPGDFVGLIFTREAALRRGLPGMIKRLVMPPPPKGFEGIVVVEQINPPRTYAIPTIDLLAIHKSIGIATQQPDGTTTIRLPKREAA